MPHRTHTPGPWHVDPTHALCIEGADGNVALVNLARASKADAHLIAAAPELLDALTDAAQTARNYYMLFHDEQWRERLARWDAVIAKARGVR